MDFWVTTNSNQTAINAREEGTGGIALTGDFNKTLKYLSNQWGYMVVSEVDVYSDDLYDGKLVINFDGSTITLQQYNDEEDYSETIYYYAQNAEYAYNTATYTLTIEPINLYKYDWDNYALDSSSVVNISGSLKNATIEIKANTPKAVDFYHGMHEDESSTIISFEKDGTFSSTTTYEYYDEEEVTTGTWEEKDGKLVITENYEDEEWVTVASYDFDGKNLILKTDMDFCTEYFGYDDYSDCYGIFEEELMIEPGSITDLTAEMEIELSPNAPSGKIRKKTDLKQLFTPPDLPIK